MKLSTTVAILFGAAVAAVTGVVSAESLRGNHLKEDAFFANKGAILRYEDAFDSEDVFSSSKSEDYEDEDDMEESDSEDIAPEDFVVIGSFFNNGLREGQQTAQKLWRNMGNSCSTAWSSFKDRIDREIRNRGWNSSSSNWTTKSFNEGARAGMQQVLKEKEKQCFNDSPDECIEVGNKAAHIIAFCHCHPDCLTATVIYSHRVDCRDVAIGQCQGQIFNQVRRECGAPNTSKTRELQNKCSNQVKSMISHAEEMFLSED